jgi:hypothetical protein
MRSTQPAETSLPTPAPNLQEQGSAAFQVGVGRSEPRNHADIDTIGLGDFRQRLPGSTALNGLSPLVVRQLPLTAELHAVGHSALAAVTGALAD